MSKAINWPEKYAEEILKENKNEIKIAIRLGTLYDENEYYKQDDIVDIRTGDKILRKAQIACPTKTTKIKNIATSDLYRLKGDLHSNDSIVKFLTDTYNKKVDEETTVTIITYKNLDIVEEEA